MITEHQKEYILSIYKEIGQEPEIDIDNLSKMKAHRTIQELLEVQNEMR